MEKLISVIVPVYNVEPYLDQCIKSIVNQSYKKLQIILVDDGSTDHSAQICDSWKEKDERICVIHKPNGGVSSARNSALAIAEGEYVGFVDSDDWIDQDMYLEMMKKMKNGKAKAVFCAYINEFKDRKEYAVNKKKSICIEKNRALEYSLKSAKRGGGYFTSLWNKLFSRELIFEGNQYIKFIENIEIGEDEIWLLEVFKKQFDVYIMSKPFYHYRIRQDGALGTKDRETAITKKNLDVLESKKKVYEMSLDSFFSENIRRLTEERLYYFSYLFHVKYYKLENKKIRDIIYENFRIGKHSFQRTENFSLLCKCKIRIVLWMIRWNCSEKLVVYLDSLSVQK